MKRKVSLKVGAKFRYAYGNRLCHVVGLVSVEEGRLVVYKQWERWCRAWSYHTELAKVIDQTRYSVRRSEPLYGNATDQLQLPIE